MAVYAVGDIHGCYRQFRRLLDAIRFNPEHDQLWLVGDVVNRGTESLATLRWLYEHQDCITLVLGNHDLHLLAVAAGATHTRSSDTLADILSAPDGDTLCSWLRQQPLAHYQHGWLMVHAGVLPMWNLQQLLALAGEAQTALSGEQWHTFVREMYGNTPTQWSDALAGAARWRVITNALTRMRICTPAGEMQLKFSGAPETIPPGYVPWFAADNRQSADVPIICGHWSALGVMQQHNVHAIDSGCLWGGALTALCLNNKQLHQVAAEENTR